MTEIIFSNSLTRSISQYIHMLLTRIRKRCSFEMKVFIQYKFLKTFDWICLTKWIIFAYLIDVNASDFVIKLFKKNTKMHDLKKCLSQRNIQFFIDFWHTIDFSWHYNSQKRRNNLSILELNSKRFYKRHQQLLQFMNRSEICRIIYE